MVLTERQKQIVASVAEVMAQNGGLYYRRLISHPSIVNAAKRSKAPRNLVDSILRRIGRNKLGLPPDAGLGMIVHEAVYQEGMNMPITAPRSIKPKLSCGEQLLLEALAKALIPKGGNYTNYREDVSNLTGRTENQIERYVKILNRKFGVANIEQALVVAFATGLLSPTEVFRTGLPRPLQEIIASHSYQQATKHLFTMYVRILTHAEEETVMEFIRLTGLNGGLYWGGWHKDVAALRKRYPTTIQDTFHRLGHKYGPTSRGNIIYAACSDLSVPIDVKIPPTTGAEFSNLELRVMLHAAEVLLPEAGYYQGYLKELAARAGIGIRYLCEINSDVVKKTETKNPGQAVTYFIAHRLVPISSLSAKAQQSRALGNISIYSGHANRLDQKYPSLSVWR